MRVRRLHVSNFRSIRQETIALERLTAFVGPNGSGKSSFLRSLHALFSDAAEVTAEDFHGSNTSQPVVLGAELADFTPGEEERFAEYISNGILFVERVFEYREGEVTDSFHGRAPRHAGFACVRMAPNAKEAKEAYKALCERVEYEDLPAWTSSAAAKEALRDWERTHPEACEAARDEGAFFTLKPDQPGSLTTDTLLVFIPAVSDAAEAGADGRGSPLTRLMDLAVRKQVETRMAPLQEDVSRRYQEVMGAAKDEELQKLAMDLSERLSRFCPGARLSLEWAEVPVFQPPLLRARPRVMEGDHPSTVDRCGHGVQRGLILALLQSFAEGGPATSTREPTSRKDFIFVIEEPELYQHPSRQRHFARTLWDLSEAAAPSTQVVYATHSPLFVGVDRFDRVRLVRKTPTPEGSLASRVRAVSFEEVAMLTGAAAGEAHTAEGLRARLEATVTPHTAEGFFADVAVLVEGDSDRAALLTHAELVNIGFDRLGVAVIPCTGKSNLPRLVALFSAFGIPIYVLWDSDEGEAQPKLAENRQLLALHDKPPEDYPACVDTRFACFRATLEKQLNEEMGSRYEAAMQTAKAEWGGKLGGKNPCVVRSALRALAAEGVMSSTLEQIVRNVAALAERRVPVIAEGEAARVEEGAAD